MPLLSLSQLRAFLRSYVVILIVGLLLVALPVTLQSPQRANAAPTVSIQTLDCAVAAFNCLGAFSTAVDTAGNIFVVSTSGGYFITRIENSGTVSAPIYLTSNVTKMQATGLPIQISADKFGNVWWGYRNGSPSNKIWKIRSDQRLTTHADLASYVINSDTRYGNHGLAIDPSNGDVYAVTILTGASQWSILKIARNAADGSYSVNPTLVSLGSAKEPAGKSGYSGNTAFVDVNRKVWYIPQANSTPCTTANPNAIFMVADMVAMSSGAAPCQPAASRMQNFSVLDGLGNIVSGNKDAGSVMVKSTAEILGSSANLPSAIPVGFEATNGAVAPNGDVWVTNRSCTNQIVISVLSPSGSTYRVHASGSTSGSNCTTFHHPSVDTNSSFFIPTTTSVIIASTTHIPQLSTPSPITAAATASTAKSVDVSWPQVSGAVSYKVKIYDSAGTALLGTKSGVSGTSTTITASTYAAIADNTSYKVTVQAIGDAVNYDDSAESSKVAVTTNINAVAPTISSHPVSLNRTSGQSATLSVTASTSDGGTLSYIWRKDGIVISGELASTLTINPIATSDAGAYTSVVTNTISNGVATSSTSTTATLTVATALTIPTPTIGLSGTANSAFSLAVPSAGGRASLTYALTGILIDGLSLSTSTGTISGTPTVAGSSTVSVTVNDANGATASTSNFTISVGYASTTVSLELAAGSPQYRTTKRITATTSRAGSVNFKLDGTTITGCGAVAVASTSAVCDWVPVDLGSAALSADFIPTSPTAYSNSTASLSATVAGRAITVTPTSSQSKVFGASDPVIGYSITAGSLYGLETLTGALSRVSGEDSGTYAITLGNLYNSNYAITLTPVDFTVAKATQASVSLTTTSGVYGTGLTLAASGGSGTGDYSFAVTTTGTAGCSITSGVLNASSPGTCTVTATRASSTNYLVANSVATTVNISKATQAAVTLTSTSGTYNTNILLVASGGTGIGDFSYSVTDAGTAGCSLAMGPSLTSSGAGTCTVTATRAGGDNYESQSSVATTVTFAKDTQNALTLRDNSGDLDTGITLSTSGGSGTGSVTYTVTSGSASCSITSGVANARNAGTCSLTATKATDSNYLQKQVTSTLTFVKATQTALQITSTSGTYGTPIELTISGGSGTGSVSYAVSDTGSASCSETGSLLSFTSVGTCKVIATRDADSIFNARSSAATTITISRATQTALSVSITTGDLITGIIVATTGGSGSGATTSSVTTGTASCSLTSGVVTAKSAGTCALTVTKASDASYLSESVTATLTFTKVISTTGKIGSATTGTVGSDITLSFTGGSGTGSVTYVVSTPGTAKCTVTDNKLSASSAGTCTVTITKQGDDTYADQVVRTEFTFTSAQVAAAPQGQMNVAAVTTTTTTTTTTTVAPSVAQSPIATTTTVPVVAKAVRKPVVTTTTTTTTIAVEKPLVAPSLVNTPSAIGAATIGGKVAKATTTRVNNQLVFTAGGFTVTLAGVRPDGSIIPLTSDGLLEVRRGDIFRLDATGFAPGSEVDIWMFSKPNHLTNIEVGANGLVRSTLKVPKSVSDGLHHLVMVGVDKANAEAKFEVGMNVGVPPKQWWYSRVLIAIPISIAVFIGFWLPTSASRRRKRQLI